MLPMQGAWVQSLVGELRSHVQLDVAKNEYMNKIAKFLKKKKLNNNNKKEWKRKLQLPHTTPTHTYAHTRTMTFYHCGLHKTNTTLPLNFSTSTPSTFGAGNSLLWQTLICIHRVFSRIFGLYH